MATRHKTVHHLSQKADGSYTSEMGWVESIAGLSENSSATNLLHETQNGNSKVCHANSSANTAAFARNGAELQYADACYLMNCSEAIPGTAERSEPT